MRRTLSNLLNPRAVSIIGMNTITSKYCQQTIMRQQYLTTMASQRGTTSSQIHGSVFNRCNFHKTLNTIVFNSNWKMNRTILSNCRPSSTSAARDYNPTSLLCCDGCKHVKLTQERLFSHTHAVLASFGQKPETDAGVYVPNDKGTNIRLHVENVYLSWIRNTYLMTIASLTIINFSITPTPAIIAAVAVVIAGMNITIGSIGYIYNLLYLRRRGHMSKWVSWVCQLGTLLHFIAWYTAASLLFPEFKIVDKELEQLEESETFRDD